MDTTVHNPAAAFANVREGRFEIMKEDFQLHDKIGEGAMAMIWKATMRGQMCAAKRLKQGTSPEFQVDNLIPLVKSIPQLSSWVWVGVTCR